MASSSLFWNFQSFKYFLKGVQVEIPIEMELAWPMQNVGKKVAHLLDLVLEGKIYSLAWKHKPQNIFCNFRFGVCCVFMTSTCSSTVSQNCSYIKNPGYPSAYTSTSSCQFTIQKCDSCKEINLIFLVPFLKYFQYFSCVWSTLGFWTVHHKWTSRHCWNQWWFMPRYTHNHCQHWSSYSWDMWRKFWTT